MTEEENARLHEMGFGMDVVYGQCTDKLFKQAEKEMNK